MEILKNNINSNLNFQNLLIRIVDVVNFDGPLLTLFEYRDNKHIYLLDWIDKDATYNRWLAYKSTPILLDKFVKGAISHYDLFVGDEIDCYIVDIDTHLNWQNAHALLKKDLPKNYVPMKDVFFEEYDCPDFAKLKAYTNLAIIAYWNNHNADEKNKTRKTYLVEEPDAMTWSVAEADTLNPIYNKK